MTVSGLKHKAPQEFEQIRWMLGYGSRAINDLLEQLNRRQLVSCRSGRHSDRISEKARPAVATCGQSGERSRAYGYHEVLH